MHSQNNFNESKKETINLNQIGPTTAIEPKKKKKFGKILIFIVIFLITAVGIFSSQILVSNQGSIPWLQNLPFIKQISHLAKSADRQLKGEDRGRINILLLGMGGKNHEGGYLTDTIILASLKPSTKKIALVSIPRDLIVPMENMGWRKINNINAFAEAENKGSGGLATSQAVSDILNIPIDYYLRVDFAGFSNIIDELGGVKVYVDRTLDDYNYPIAGRESAEPYESRFEHLHIDKGWQTMDGKLALKYVRSRHAAGIEGSDFARARRQQKIIEAIKSKLFSAHIIFKPKMVANIINQMQTHFSTNLKIWEMVKFWNMFNNITSKDITTKVLDNSPDGLLMNKISTKGAYILVPRSGDFAEIQYLIANIFSKPPISDRATAASERPTVEIRNGTWINGLASRVAVDLEKYGFTIVRVGNSNRQNFQKNVIYDLSYGEKSKSLAILKEKTNANVDTGLPDWLAAEISQQIKSEKNPIQPDFILVLGQEADKTKSGIANPEDNIK